MWDLPDLSGRRDLKVFGDLPDLRDLKVLRDLPDLQAWLRWLR